jgi:thiamine kinase-like enzyme
VIDWDFAGPVDPLVDLAQACWLNAKLYSDDVADMEGLPPLDERSRHLRAIVDGYGLAATERAGLVDQMIGVAVAATANEADEASVTPSTTEPKLIWALAWRARSAAWMLRHRSVLQNALNR